MEKRSIQNTRNKVFIVFIRQGGRNPGRRAIKGGKIGRRTWAEHEATAANRPSSASPTKTAASGVSGGRYPILLVVRMKLSMRALSTARAKPHQAGAAYLSLAKVVALVTLVLLIVAKVRLSYFAATALCREGFAVITLEFISSRLTL